MNLNVDWKEALLIFGALVIMVLLFYLINKKQIEREEKMRKKIQEMSHEPMDYHVTAPVEKRKATPQVLSAYERMTILLDRIDINKLATRVHPISEEKQDYANFLIQHIEQEYDFNVSQQLYVSEEAWALILTAKNTIIQNILRTTLQTDVKNATDLRNLLIHFKENQSLTDLAKNRLRKEVAEFL